MDYYRGLSGTLEELHLILVILEDWILIQRATIDIHIDEEPYNSIQVYANATTKRYIVRAWGKSIKSGDLPTTEDLRELCINYFGRFVACAGYLGPHPGQGLDLVRVNYPCTRWISRSCAITFAQDQDALIVGLCSACSGEALRGDDITKKEEVDVADEKSLPAEEKPPPETVIEKQEDNSVELDDTGEPLNDAPEPVNDDDAWLPPRQERTSRKEIKKKPQPKSRPKTKNSDKRLRQKRRLKFQEKENGVNRLEQQVMLD